MTRPAPADVVTAIRDVYGVKDGAIPLHAPVFGGNESKYVQSTIDSTFVSSVGQFVNDFERKLAEITGARFAIATVNGTTALQIAMVLAGVKPGDMIITQSLSFVATPNAASHAGATTAFVDIDRETLGLCPKALAAFLESECRRDASGITTHIATGKRVAAIVPMHTFGHPCNMIGILDVAQAWGIPVIEDAAESLGSRYQGRGCGTFGLLGTLSFNGNKIVTTGGGGAILTNDEALAKRGKHLTTTAKLPDRWRFMHDEVGYNFRLPNINAALGVAQLERLDAFIAYKRDLAARYRDRFKAMGIEFVSEPANSQSIYWLCAILARDVAERDAILTATNDAGVMTRPVWEPLHTLPMYAASPCGPLPVTKDIAARLVNIPSGFQESARP